MSTSNTLLASVGRSPEKVVPMPADRRGVPDRVRVERTKERRVRIAILAPPWIPVPPPGYGGIEFVVGAIPACDRQRAGGPRLRLDLLGDAAA
jgi:hypothetical protein